MRHLYHRCFTVILGFAVISSMVLTADAQRRSEREIRDNLRSLNSKIDDFDTTLRFQLSSSSARQQTRSDAASGIDALKGAVSIFSENLDLRRENRADINGIVAAAQDLNGFLRAHPQNRRIGSTWSDIMQLIDKLAANYGVTPDWSGRVSSAANVDNDYIYADGGGAVAGRGGLTGTYRFDINRSESVADIVASTRATASQRQDLGSKLEAPEQIALSIRGSNVTLASSIADPVSFVADGRERSEMANGRNVRMRATLRGDTLTVSSLGGETDYTIVFDLIDGGRTLKVTRRITTEYLSETVFADSFYNKIDAVARLGIGGMDDQPIFDDDDAYSSNDPNDRVGANSPNPTLSQPRIGEFIVPNGAILTGSLENEINTKVSQNNDRFRMTVQSPVEYRGAVIEGYITGVGRSGQVSGRSNVTFNFERITLRNGRAYDFAGSVTAVRDHTGKEVKVDTEGTAKGDSQTTETAKRGGIGAGLGAVIGAIAGGAKGAAIGAVIGGGAGVGSVIVGGRDDVRLMPGSTVTVESSSPIRNQRDDY